VTRILVVRGHQATPWELRPWEDLPDRFSVSFLRTRRNRFDVNGLRLRAVPARTLRGGLPRGVVGDVLALVAGDRYIAADAAFAAADVVHAEELSYWFADEAAKRKERHGYRLVLSVWETLPLLDAFRNRHAREYRRNTLTAADLFLAATERARESLLLEGVPEDRIEVTYPGVDVERFRRAAESPPEEHLVVSPGRLVWEKGHQDVMRAVAAIRRGLVPAPVVPRLHVVGSGPEQKRLERYAKELGIDDLVEIGAAGSYDEMPAIFARATALVLASLSSAACQLRFGDVPRCFWEEQFGLVLAEGMAAGLPLVVSRSGAIPEVAGERATYFTPGDWMGIAQALATGPLAQPPTQRVEYPSEQLERYSTQAAANRLAAAYDRVLAS
jgi:glycosyltransferase involved in cell wall biosynthesis